ncbi:MAG: hypothetical protein A2Z98_12025 [Spirochaetes bacterium GWB1_27_13]|nr:MAG: hypothetical protein A2Z98_12025 [Spirochaetes bacterium GWB1_27_13]
MEKILITDQFDETLLDNFSKKYPVTFKPDISYGELIKEVTGYEILIISTRIPITKEIVENATKLKLIIRMGIGVDHIDLEQCKKHKIIVCNTPNSNISSVVELVFGQIIREYRSLDLANANVLNGNFRHKYHLGDELKDKTIGVIGVGRIGSRLCNLAKMFEMTVVGYDPYLTKAKIKKAKVDKWLPLPELLNCSDIVTLHIPHTKETDRLINKTFLSMMKKDSILINVARGKVANFNDVLEFAKKDIIRKFIFDVFPEEPCKIDLPEELKDYFYFSPHIGAYTKESLVNRSIEAIEQLEEYFFGKKPHGKIDFKKGY